MTPGHNTLDDYKFFLPSFFIPTQYQETNNHKASIIFFLYDFGVNSRKIPFFIEKKRQVNFTVIYILPVFRDMGLSFITWCALKKHTYYWFIVGKWQVIQLLCFSCFERYGGLLFITWCAIKQYTHYRNIVVFRTTYIQKTSVSEHG